MEVGSGMKLSHSVTEESFVFCGNLHCSLSWQLRHPRKHHSFESTWLFFSALLLFYSLPFSSFLLFLLLLPFLSLPFCFLPFYPLFLSPLYPSLPFPLLSRTYTLQPLHYLLG